METQYIPKNAKKIFFAKIPRNGRPKFRNLKKVRPMGMSIFELEGGIGGLGIGGLGIWVDLEIGGLVD